MHSLLDPARLRPPTTLENVQPSSELTTGQHAKVNLTLGLQGGSGGGGEGEAELATNPLHLQAPSERDLIIRNRIKTPTLDDIIVEADHHLSSDVGVLEDNEIKSISSMQFQRNSSNV